MPTFTPGVNPSYDYQKAHQTRIKKADFGDGYSQRTGDGLNAVAVSPTLSFIALSLAEADAIESFFVARGGYESFEYTLPDESTARQWVTSEEGWARTATGPDLYTINVTLTEVFDIT